MPRRAETGLRGSAWRSALVSLVSVALLAGAPGGPEAGAAADEADRPSSAAKAKLRRCGSIVFTPQSGEVLSRIATRGIRCRAAKRKLWAWRNNAYRPRSGPRGYTCRGPNRPFTRKVCRRHGRRVPLIAFTSGD